MLTTTTWIALCILLYFIKKLIIQPFEDKTVYKMYAIRDELAMKVIQKKIMEDDKKYGNAINKINFSIYYTKNDYPFTIVFKNIVLESLNRNSEDWYDYIKSNEHTDYAFSKVYEQFFRSLKVRLMVFTYCCLYPCQIVLSLICWCLKIIDFTKSLALTKKVDYYKKSSIRYITDTKEYCQMKYTA